MLNPVADEVQRWQRRPSKRVQHVLRSIDETLDFYSVGGICDGVYKMDDGSKARDRSVMVWAVVAPEQVDELRALAARIAGMLKQESLYFEVTDVDFDLVRPSDKNGGF